MVPINAKLHVREAEWIVANAQARWAFVTGDVAPAGLAGLEHHIDVESDAYRSLAAPLADAFEEHAMTPIALQEFLHEYRVKFPVGGG